MKGAETKVLSQWYVYDKLHILCDNHTTTQHAPNYYTPAPIPSHFSYLWPSDSLANEEQVITQVTTLVVRSFKRKTLSSPDSINLMPSSHHKFPESSRSIILGPRMRKDDSGAEPLANISRWVGHVSNNMCSFGDWDVPGACYSSRAWFHPWWPWSSLLGSGSFPISSSV